MKVLYFDGEAGAAGDMILGALIALGLDDQLLAQVVDPIAPAPFALRAESISINGIAARRCDAGASSSALPARAAVEVCHRQGPFPTHNDYAAQHRASSDPRGLHDSGHGTRNSDTRCVALHQGHHGEPD